MSHLDSSLHIVIVGAGTGGLTTAIACRRANPQLKITILEKCPDILSIGAGIHIPPNACRILTQFGLLDKLKQAGGYEVEHFTLKRYADGHVLASRPLKRMVESVYGAQWLAIHRGDYQQVLLQAAIDLGATILTHTEAINVQFSRDEQAIVFLHNGEEMHADVVIGADGLWSRTREIVVGHHVSPNETGDLAYRGTFTRQQLLNLQDERVDELLKQPGLNVWLGPGKHAVFYPLRDQAEYNLVLLVADDLPSGMRTASATLEEMTGNFHDWDPTLRKIVSCSSAEPLKWKLLHLTELQQWTRSTIALLGDASHPSLPYQGQGAAMAVEDGATLGMLLSAFCSTDMTTTQRERNEKLTEVLQLYQELRKHRAEITVAGGVHTCHFYHLPDGIAQRRRDEELARLSDEDWHGSCSFKWGDAKYQKELLGFDVAAHVDSGVSGGLRSGLDSTNSAKACDVSCHL